MYDAVIIGAGVTGAAAAWQLSRLQAKICVLERGEDVCVGTSKANSAIIHAGYDPVPGTLMAKLNVEGNEMMDKVCADLDVPFRRNGALIVCTDGAKRDVLDQLLSRGIRNGVQGLRILERDELLEMEPNLSDDVIAALYAPTSGIVCPFELTIGMAENACENGVEFYFDSEVTKITRDGDGNYHITAGGREYVTRAVINAAGVYADQIHNMVSEEKITIRPRRGEYCLYDKELGGFVSHTIFQLPTEKGKGVLVTPTVHGNLLAGPTSEIIADKDDTSTTASGIAEVLEKENISVKPLPGRKIITSFAGLRAHGDKGDFIIGEVKDAPLFYDLAGIESPGLSSAPAIGKMTKEWAKKALGLGEKTDCTETRRAVPHFSDMDPGRRQELIAEDPLYGQIVCRCETVTEGEIVSAIRRPLGARSLDGVKRRTRAGMGRCQAGFCSPKVLEIIHRETGLPYDRITKCGGASTIVLEHTKGQTAEEAEGRGAGAGSGSGAAEGREAGAADGREDACLRENQCGEVKA